MRYPGTYRHDPRGIIDKFNLYPQVININRVKMQAAGTPSTYYKNTSVDEFGNYNKTGIRCYCWKEGIDSQPNPRHALCLGTGVLSGYQKYGFTEEVFAIPSVKYYNLTLPSFIIPYSSNDYTDIGYKMSGQELLGDIITHEIKLNRFLEFDRFIALDDTDGSNNKVEYYYSLDNINWTRITVTPYTKNSLGNKEGKFDLPAGTERIWFRIRLRKRYTTSQSPSWQWIRFRYRNMRTLMEIYPRHQIEYPAFLIGREQVRNVLKQGQQGVEIRHPQLFWVLPEINVNNLDIVEYYFGPWGGKKFIVTNMERRLHGPEQVETSKSFETTPVRDNSDLFGILNLLY